MKCQKIEPKFVSELALASLVVIAAAAAMARQAFLKDQVEPRYDQEVRLSLVLSLWYSRPESRAKIRFFVKCYSI